MQHQFRALLSLSEKDPTAYRIEVARLRDEEPECFAEFLEELGEEIAREGWSCARRQSSIAALALGDIDALLAKRRP